MNNSKCLAQLIFDFMVEGNKPCTIKEISKEFPLKPQSTIRGRIYDNLEKLFRRVGRGIYVAVTNNGSVALIHGDGRDLSFLDDNSIDAIVTDHPWSDEHSNKGGNRNFTEYDCFKYTLNDFQQKARVLKEGGFLVEFLPAENENNFEYLYQIKQMAKQCGLMYYSKVSWKKGSFVSNTGRKAKNSEDVMFFTKGKARSLRTDTKKSMAAGEKCLMSGTAFMLPTMFDVQPVARNKRIHQAEKPVALLEQIIEAISLPGEILLDQYSGSGSLGEAALKGSRLCILIEKCKDCIEKAAERLQCKYCEGIFEI